MRYAIVSDIHANLQAWQAVQLDLASAGAERVISLGDVIGYGPSPADVLESVYAHVHHFILGNHDAVLCGKMDADLFNDRARLLLDWTRSHLSPAAQRILAQWPLTLKGDGFRCAHGDFSAPAFFRYVLDPEDALASWRSVEEPLLFIGHSHCPGLYVLGSSGIPRYLDPQDFALEPGKRYLVNVGSVGQPRDGDPRASYCLYDSESRSVFWRRIPFDLDQYRQALQKAGLPEDSSPFLNFDPRSRIEPIRPMLGFHPPESLDKAARHVVTVQEIESLRQRVRAWRRTALLLLVLGLAGLATYGGLLWQRHLDGPVTRSGIGPLALVAAHYPVGSNLLVWPDQALDTSRAILGWTVCQGSSRRQTVTTAADAEGHQIILLKSETDALPIVLQSPIIQAEPGQKFTAEARFQKSRDFQGSIALSISLSQKTDTGEKTIEHFVLKEPNLNRRGGWSAVQETFETPSGTTRIQFHLRGQFQGEVKIGHAALLRR